MTPPPTERGTALLTVLLLVAVMATIASTMLDKVGLATTLAANARTAGQARHWLATAEALTLVRVQDLVAAQPGRLTDRGYFGVRRTVHLPDGGRIEAELRDGGNCFNLNALARRVDQRVLAARPAGVDEFASLMAALGFPPTRARQIAARAADYIDDDDLPLADGLERGGYPEGALPANRMMADASELRAVPGVSAQEWQRLSPWLCALPVVGGSPVNVNTLRPDQAQLLVMLSRGAFDLTRAKAIIARRPPAGFSQAAEAVPASQDEVVASPDAVASVRTRFFKLVAHVGDVRGDDTRYAMTSLIEATPRDARVLGRRWDVQ